MQIRVCNITEKAMHLSKGIGLSPLEMVQMSGMEALPSVETEYDNIVDSIVDRVDPSVLSGDRLKLAALLNKHKHVLSRNELDIGCTSIVQHGIETGDHLPCRQAQRQQPITTRQIVDASLEEIVGQPDCGTVSQRLGLEHRYRQKERRKRACLCRLSEAERPDKEGRVPTTAY